MKTSKKPKPVKYKNKDVEITGNPRDVNGYIWTDMISSKVLPIIFLGFIFLIREVDLLPLILAWLRRQGFI